MARLCPVCGTTYPDTVRFCPDDASTLHSTDEDGDLIGEVVADRYQVTALLGEGGMGRVYVARHVRLPQQVAIKVLHPALVVDTSAVARFNREAANAARIEHDRVARVFDFGETGNGAVYIAMEFVAGRTLRALLASDAPLAPVRAANVIYQVSDGLEAAHRLQIVHRDLKPDNILVATDELGADRVKIVDFGIAKALDGRDAKLTQTGMAVGTPEYMSPEQLFGEEVDARTDVYALALVAFKCFTGTLPFASDTPERSMIARVGAKPKTLAAALPDVAWPAALQDAFDGALAMEPSDRTTSALAFGDAIVAAVEAWTGESVLRGRTPLSSASIPALSVSRTTGSSSAVAAPAPAPTPSVASSSPPSRSAMKWVIPVGVLAAAGVGAFLLKRPADLPDGREAAAGAPAAVADSARQSSGATAAVPVQTPATPPRESTPVAAPDRPPAAAPVTDAAPSAPAPTRTRDTVEAANDASEARATLTSIRQTLAADDADEATARQAVVRLERLLSRLPSRTDSASAYIALISAHGMAGHPERACTPLRAARALATTAAQQEIVRRASDQLTCAP